MSLTTYLNPDSIEGGTINRNHINVKPNDSNNLLASTEKPGVVQLVDNRYSTDTDKAPTARVISDINNDISYINNDIEFISRGNLSDSIKPSIGGISFSEKDNKCYINFGTTNSAFLKLVGNFNIKLNDEYYFSKCVGLTKEGRVCNNCNNYINNGPDGNNTDYIIDNGKSTYLYEIAKKGGEFNKNELDSVIKYITFDCIYLDINSEYDIDIDNYNATGEYVIRGSFNGTNCSNLPISNNGYIDGNLKVISYTYDDNSGIILHTTTQIFTLLNDGGGDGNIYTRTYQNGEWEPWRKMQTNVEVGSITDEGMKELRDNGVYSGVLESTTETFVLVVINNYAIATQVGYGGYISQLKYSVDVDGNVMVKTRRSDAYGDWSDWDDVDGVTEIEKDLQGRVGYCNIKPNKYYKFINVGGELYINFEDENNSKLKNYMFEVTFVSGNTLSLPEDIKWANGVTPQICKEGGTYQISVINKLGIITEFLMGDVNVKDDYFTLHVLEDDCIMTLHVPTYYNEKPSYSVNENNWVSFDTSVELPLSKDNEVRIKCVTDSYKNVYNEDEEDDSKYLSMFNCNCDYEVKGNIMSLLYGDEFKDKTSLCDDSEQSYNASFDCLFRKQTNLKKCDELILPATTLADNCYESMFEGCTSLTTTPELPATELAKYCYAHMFSGCLRLTTAPKLPAEELANGCYYYMFFDTHVLPDCSNIDFENEKVVASGGLSGLFAGTKVTDDYLEQILTENSEGKYCLPVTTAADYESMFEDCTSLTTAPELPATTLAYGCYARMFKGCTSLTTAPELPATTLADGCYLSMFKGCTSLNTAPALPATTLAERCYDNMFYGCTGLTTAPALPATELAKYCYSGMFSGCSTLDKITMLATDIDADHCLYNWVGGVADDGDFYKHPDMYEENFSKGDSGIPNGWNVYDYNEESQII